MTIEHRDIPDSERHELKGASVAQNGAVPVANGSGVTVFKRLGVESLQGSISPGEAGRLIVTDGSGGFQTTAVGAYASMTLLSKVSDVTVGGSLKSRFATINSTGLVKGVTFAGGKFYVNSTGVYRTVGWVYSFDNLENPIRIAAAIHDFNNGALAGNATEHASFVNLSAGSAYVILTGATGVSSTNSGVLSLEKIVS